MTRRPSSSFRSPFVLGSLAAFAGCSGKAAPPPRGSTPANTAITAAAATTPMAQDAAPPIDAAFDASLDLAPLAETAPMVDLAVPAAANAKASIPLAAVRPRPSLVALHGNFDRPEWTCEIWSWVADGYPFVLCPRGTSRKDAPGQDRWTYPGSTAANRELDSVLGAAEERWGAHLLEGPVVYAGFSLGAILGVPIVAADPARFPRVILVEGGHDGWTDARAAAFAAGAKAANIEPRVLFVCAQSGCTGDAEPARKALVKHGASARVVSAGNVGHQYGGVVAETTKKNFAWVVDGLPGWSEINLGDAKGAKD